MAKSGLWHSYTNWMSPVSIFCSAACSCLSVRWKKDIATMLTSSALLCENALLYRENKFCNSNWEFHRLVSMTNYTRCLTSGKRTDYNCSLMAAHCGWVRMETQFALHRAVAWGLGKTLKVGVNANKVTIHPDPRWNDPVHSVWRLVPRKGKETISSRIAICIEIN